MVLFIVNHTGVEMAKMSKNKDNVLSYEPKARFQGRIIRFGGVSFILLAFLYPLLFLNANLPDSLTHSWQEVLTSLRNPSISIIFFWLFVSVLPVLVLTGAYGAYEALKDKKLLWMKIALIFAYVSAFSFMIGISRWSGILWTLSAMYQKNNESENLEVFEEIYRMTDLYFGQYIGQNMAEIFFFMFILLVSFASFRHPRIPNWQACIGLIASVFGLTGAFRHYHATAEAFFTVSQVLSLTTIWMITFGLALLLYKRREG